MNPLQLEKKTDIEQYFDEITNNMPLISSLTRITKDTKPLLTTFFSTNIPTFDLQMLFTESNK